MKTQNKPTGKSNKGILTACLILIFFSALQAQDRIILKNGNEISAKVLEINDTEVKYKREGFTDGPTRIMLKSEIFSVNYLNGTKDVFGTGTGPVEYANTQVIYIKQPATDNKFDPDTSDFANVKRKNFSGPRVGVTYISAGTAADYLAAQGKQPMITQFGWQFEERLFTVEGNTQGIVEFIPMVGGVEQGMFIPSASVLIGLRSGGKRTFEFAMGPNFSVVPNYLGQRQGAIGLVIAAGTSFKKGNINFPVNLAFVPSVGSTHQVYDFDTNTSSQKKFQTGFRLSLVVGFNSRKK